MSQRHKVLVGISMHPNSMARLSQATDVTTSLDYAGALHETVATYDAMILYVPQFDPAILHRAERLKIIACHACPSEMLDIAAERGIQVSLAPGLRETVADMTLALMFAAARNIAASDAAIRRGEWPKQDLKVRFSGLDVFGKTLGILGLGRIGSILASRVRGFDMRLLYYDAVRKPQLERELGVEYCQLDDLLAASDFVSVHLPLIDSTRGLIGEHEFGMMKPGAILINTARGAIIDEDAMCKALATGQIAGAGLDVFAHEPLPDDSPLLSLDNVVLAPHLGGSTQECDDALVDDVLRVLAGRTPLYPVL